MNTKSDNRVLRTLAGEWAGWAAGDADEKRIERWRDLNDLRPVRPLLWINELPWNEFGDDFLSLRCADEFLRGVEQNLRRTLYARRHFPGDMFLDPVWYAEPAVSDSGFGLAIREEAIPQGAGDVASHHYRPVIRDFADVEKIRDPEIALDRDETERRLERLQEAFGPELPVVPGGVATIWYAPWDILVMWYGVTEALTDMVMNPELIHAAMRRLTDAQLARLEQFDALGLLCYGNGNYRVGSGAMGCSRELEARQPAVPPVHPRQQWGCAVAQILGSVSPEMHQEFALRYEREWLDRFGLTYYGCCEPLDRKIDILRSIPNLRKISASPWCDLERLVGEVGRDYVISLKPNPEIFARDAWNPSQAEANLRRSLETLRGCNVEVVAKDVSTLRGEVGRLSRWAEMALNLCREYNP